MMDIHVDNFHMLHSAKLESLKSRLEVSMLSLLSLWWQRQAKHPKADVAGQIEFQHQHDKLVANSQAEEALVT